VTQLDVIAAAVAAVFSNGHLSRAGVYTPPGGGVDDELVVRVVVAARRDEMLGGLSADTVFYSGGTEIDVKGAVVEEGGTIRIDEESFRIVGAPRRDQRTGIFRCRCA